MSERIEAQQGAGDEDVEGYILPIIYGLAFGYGMMAGAGITTAILNHTTGTLNGPLQRR